MGPKPAATKAFHGARSLVRGGRRTPAATEEVSSLRFGRCGVRAYAKQSVSGVVYESDEGEGGAPVRVRLFTKEGCTLCDQVKATLLAARQDFPHSLEQVDITDADNAAWHAKYKWDIPVLHVGSAYWAKHRLSPEEAREGLREATANPAGFAAREGEPDASEAERRQAERASREGK